MDVSTQFPPNINDELSKLLNTIDNQIAMIKIACECNGKSFNKKYMEALTQLVHQRVEYNLKQFVSTANTENEEADASQSSSVIECPPDDANEAESTIDEPIEEKIIPFEDIPSSDDEEDDAECARLLSERIDDSQNKFEENSMSIGDEDDQGSFDLLQPISPNSEQRAEVTSDSEDENDEQVSVETSTSISIGEMEYTTSNEPNSNNDSELEHRSHSELYFNFDFESEIEKVLIQKTGREERQSIHNGVKKLASFECFTCRKRFAKMHHLKQHLFVHGGIKTYECTVCGQSFTHAGSKNLHQIHCERVNFESQLNQNEQRNKHDGFKLFKCRYCEQAFVSACRRRKHEDRCGSTTFECFYCKLKFSEMSVLKMHLLIRHAA